MNRRGFIGRFAALLGGAVMSRFAPSIEAPKPDPLAGLGEDDSPIYTLEPPECIYGPPWDVNCRCDPCVEHYALYPDPSTRWMIFGPGENVAAGSLVYLNSDGYVTKDPPNKGGYFMGVATGKTKDQTAEVRFR